MSKDPLEALTIGDFRIEKRIGSGGMGVVYQAKQLSLDRVVALKVLGQSLTSKTAIARFCREARAAAKLNHPHIASIHYVGQSKDVCYMALEFIDGVPLRRALEQLTLSRKADATLESIVKETPASDLPQEIRFDEPTTPYDVTPEDLAPKTSPHPQPDRKHTKQLIRSRDHIRLCCELIRDAADALFHAHEQGVVHRDLKPENLMIDRQGSVHIIDFGIARFFEDATLTNTGALVGTPMYMSPEQVTGRLDLDHRTDIYSLGLVLFELLTLTPAMSAPTREAVLRRIVTKTLPPITRRNDAVPRDLENIVHKSIAKDPDDRYQSAKELSEDLQRFLDGQPVHALPYRFSLDEGEVAATRPNDIYYAITAIATLTTVSCTVFTLSVMMAWPQQALLDLILIPFLVGLAGYCCSKTMSALPQAKPSLWLLIGLIHARVIGWLIYPPVYLEKRSVYLFLIMPLSVAAVILVCISSNASREWFRLAERVRRDEAATSE